MAGGTYAQYARDGYMRNEIIFAAIEMRATSAAEPSIIGVREILPEGRARQLRRALIDAGVPPTHADYRIRAARHEKVTDHPAVRLLNRPNPYMSRFQLWSSVIMHRDLAGNAYLWKRRPSPDEPPGELWPLRPDRVRIIPGKGSTYIEGYRYTIAGQTIDIPFRDVIHFRTRHPLDDYYGMPPLMPISGRVDLDNYMRDFVLAFFRNGGQPGAVLTVKQGLDEDAKEEIRKRYRSGYGDSRWFDLMVLDGTEASFTPMTMALGARGLVMPELNAISEARLAMAFGIPLSILGALTGQESSSYANKRQDWQVFWDLTLAPLYSDLDDVLNLHLLPEYSGLDALQFDLSQVKALQEDVDAIRARWRADLMAGGVSLEEFRAAGGMEPMPAEGTFLIPANYMVLSAAQLSSPETVTVLPSPIAALHAARVPEARCPDCGKLCGKDVLAGESIYCRRCKTAFAAGVLTEPAEPV